MIKVEYSISNQTITYLSVSGHANFDETGKDLICAGASTIMYGLLNVLDSLDDKDVEYKIDENETTITINNKSKSNKIKDYLDLALIQLKTIEESYKDYIKVVER